MKHGLPVKVILAAVLVLALGSGCGSGRDVKKTDGAIGAPLNKTDVLQPGLNALYLFKKYRDIDEMPSDERFLSEGLSKGPLPRLDHQFGTGNVFESERSQGVGMLISGFINLDPAGTYAFQVLSNDGVRVVLGEKMILNDPGVHGDQLTESGPVQVDAAGWHPLNIKYFQRKGSAALSFRWKKPGQESYTPVPAEALAHQPQTD
ncbi:MAG: PA14 domain-containing protein [Pseudomonadota bacterium]